jgi:hypothetical protein
MMLPQGTLEGEVGGGASYARYAGLLIVLTLIIVTFAQLAAFLWMNDCVPLQDAAGNLVIFKDQIVETCSKRLDPGAQAQWALAVGGTLGGTAGWFYRETKRAEVANGSH